MEKNERLQFFCLFLDRKWLSKLPWPHKYFFQRAKISVVFPNFLREMGEKVGVHFKNKNFFLGGKPSWGPPFFVFIRKLKKPGPQNIFFQFWGFGRKKKKSKSKFPKGKEIFLKANFLTERGNFCKTNPPNFTKKWKPKVIPKKKKLFYKVWGSLLGLFGGIFFSIQNSKKRGTPYYF